MIGNNKEIIINETTLNNFIILIQENVHIMKKKKWLKLLHPMVKNERKKIILILDLKILQLLKLLQQLIILFHLLKMIPLHLQETTNT